MNCEQYQENISQFIDGELESTNEFNVFHHLGTCDECRGFLKETINLRSELLKKQAPLVPEQLDRTLPPAMFKAHGEIKPLRYRVAWIWRDRTISLRAAGVALLFTILASVACTSVWYHANAISQETAVYIPTLPAVEVRGYIPSSSNLNN